MSFLDRWRRKSDGQTIEAVMRRFETLMASSSGIAITPETCMQSPTVCALVNRISDSLASLSLKVEQVKWTNGREITEPMPSHPVARLLNNPNQWQTKIDFWRDAVSLYLRYGNFYCLKLQGKTGPIRYLIPRHPSAVTPRQDPQTYDVTYDVVLANGGSVTHQAWEFLHVRQASRDGLVGYPSLMDIKESIGLEIAAERMGASVFGNNATPGVVLQFAEKAAGFKTDEEREAFVDSFQKAYSGKGRWRAMLLPKGIEIGKDVPIDNDKAQFLASRQFQRTVIAGVLGVPPHMVGDLTKMTFGNVEQQSLDFERIVTLPIARTFETAMERDLLTVEDRRAGVRVRFNLASVLRADFKTRQEGLKVQRESGIISANEWRAMEGMNPISKEDGGDEYWRKGPSGQSAEGPVAEDPKKPAEDEEDEPSDNEDEDEGKHHAQAA